MSSLLGFTRPVLPVDAIAFKPSVVPPSTQSNALWLDETTGRLVLGADPGEPLAFLSDINGGNYPDTAETVPAFIPSGVVVVPSIGTAQGDPFIVFDADANQYVMYYFTLTGGGLVQYYITAPRVGGAWSAPTQVASLNGFHKFVMLVNENDRSTAQLVDDLYHGYASAFVSGLTGPKQISHFTSPSLYGPWTSTGVVVSPSGSVSPYDNYTCDAPCAISDSTNIYLYYMANPSSNVSTPTGYASVVMYAVGSVAAPEGPFARNNTPALLPSSTVGQFDYGWLGGVQIVRFHSSSMYAMVYNAGYTRPLSAGAEPSPGDIGVAFSSSIAGPWVRSPNNPVTSYANTPDNYPGQAIYWRPFYVYDPVAKAEYLYYNVSAPNAGSGEAISYALANVGEYSNIGAGAFQVIDSSSGVLSINNTYVYLPQPGVYKLDYDINVFANNIPGSPNGLDLQFTIVNQLGALASEGGTSLKYTLPALAFWNDDQRTTATVVVNAPSTYHVNVQVVGGTAPAPGLFTLQVRHPRFRVTRVIS